MTEQVEQRICVKFCVKLECSSAETIQIIWRLLGTMQWVQHKHKCGTNLQRPSWITVESDPCSGRPATNRTPENVERVGAATNKDQWLTVWELELIWGFQTLLCLTFWGRILAWNVSWQNSFCGFCYQSRRNVVLQLGECARSQDAHFAGDWSMTVLCTVFLGSGIFFSKCLYVSCYMAGYLLDRPHHILSIYLLGCFFSNGFVGVIYIRCMSPFSDTCTEMIFSHLVSCLCALLIVHHNK